MEAYLHATGSPRTARRMVDAVQRIGPPPARAFDGSLAREPLALVVGGERIEVMVERHARPYGGAQGYWRAPCCDRRCCHLFVVPSAPAGSALACRKCFPGGLTYRSQHVLHPALIRAAKLRRKLGAAPGLLSAIPKRPPRWRRDHWDRMVAELAAAESVIAELLGATVRALERRKGRLHGPR